MSQEKETQLLHLCLGLGHWSLHAEDLLFFNSADEHLEPMLRAMYYALCVDHVKR